MTNRIKFQSQEHITELNLNWDSFKWRNHQPEIGRFFGLDPLAETFRYNSPYAFSENKVVRHIELEGLEATDAMAFYNQAGDALERAVVGVENFFRGLFQSGSGIPNSPEAPISQETRQILGVTNKPQELAAIGDEIAKKVPDAALATAEAGFSVLEDGGDALQKAGAGAAVVVPEVGIPAMGLGSAIEKIGTAGKFGLDLAKGDYKNASFRVVTFMTDRYVTSGLKSISKDFGKTVDENNRSLGIFESLWEFTKEFFGAAGEQYQDQQTRK